MSFRLPTADHPAREYLGDMAHVAEVLNPANLDKLPEFSAALRSARQTALRTPGARAVACICLRGDDERWLILVGPRGGWRKIWNFGTGRD